MESTKVTDHKIQVLKVINKIQSSLEWEKVSETLFVRVSNEQKHDFTF